MSRRGLTRRHFLAGVVASSAAVAAALLGRPRPAVDGDDVAERLRTFLSDFTGAAALGRLVPDGALVEPAADVVAAPGTDAVAWFAGVDDDAFAGQVVSSVAADLAAGRTVDVDGWTLTRTEAAVCVLAASVDDGA